MLLEKVLKKVHVENIIGSKNIKINDIKYDSRQIKDGNLFICIQGFKTDGHKYIPDAIQKQAKAVLIDKEVENYSKKITYIKVDDSRKAMAKIAKNFFKDPLEKIELIGVTGTNGKTTTTYLIKDILNKSGYKTGLIGTIEVYDGENSLDASRTTPESLDIYKYLAKMRDNDVKYAVMEVSSHALALNRVDTMQFKTAVFTNLSQDHLDYHKTMQKYAEEKVKLFKKIKKEGTAIINNDDQYSSFFKNNTKSDIITYGIEESSDLKATNLKLALHGVSFNLDNMKYDLHLTGKFNIYNSLAAIGTALSLGIDEKTIKESLESIQGIPGRFETINLSQDFTVIIDYAHTPDSMINVLESLKNFRHEDVIIVFGCGGERDKDKRPKMGKIAVKYGDYVVVTTDNPRSEEPDTIIEEIIGGIIESKYNTQFTVNVDRKDAIIHAVNKAKKDDVVIVFGKGHETYQVFADKTIDFNDKEVAISAINDKLSGV
ncbi:MAG: UDP-N-acetylmuramoyl-L-alanyl-D-glutamate--2,6-diaminopimelate ligase [Bacillota bacterium]